MRKFSDVEKALYKMYPQGLHLQKYVHDPDSSLREFIRAFLLLHNKKFHTMHGEALQCSKGRYRSLGDIFLICRSYYPDCSLKEVRDVLNSLVNPEDHAYSAFCNDISRMVYNADTRLLKHQYMHYSPTSKNEFGWTIKDTPDD